MFSLKWIKWVACSHNISFFLQATKLDVSTEQVQWADSVFVVYAINDKTSFDLARTMVEYVYSVSAQNQLPVALVANKSDMLDRKEVSDTEVSRLCAEFNLFFFETSASESRKSVADLFTTLSRQVRHIMKKREKLTSFMSNPAVAAKLQIRQSLRNLAERTWRARTSTLWQREIVSSLCTYTHKYSKNCEKWKTTHTCTQLELVYLKQIIKMEFYPTQ